MDKGGKYTFLLVQQDLGFVVLQDDAPLHHNHKVGIQDGVDAMLCKRTWKDYRFDICIFLYWGRLANPMRSVSQVVGLRFLKTSDNVNNNRLSC